MTPVVVEWVDAHADPSGGWVQPSGIDQRPYRVTSIGWLLVDGKPAHLSLAQSWGRMDGDDKPEAVDHVLHIPARMVLSVRSLPADPGD